MCVPASDLASGAEVVAEPIQAQQLFSLLLAADSHCPQFAMNFDYKTFIKMVCTEMNWTKNQSMFATQYLFTIEERIKNNL